MGLLRRLRLFDVDFNRNQTSGPIVVHYSLRRGVGAKNVSY